MLWIRPGVLKPGHDPWLLLLVICLCVSPVVGAEETWRAGTGRVKITPPQFMWMAGYASRTKAADGVYADLWARALVLEDARGRRSALVSLDLVGIDRELSRGVCQLLSEQCRLSRDQVALCCSHTHSGPVVGRCLEPLHYHQLDPAQRQLVDDYQQWIKGCIGQCVSAAIDDLQPSRLAWGSGYSTFATNRRANPEKEVVAARAAGSLRGPVDYDVPVLSVRSSGGQLRAVVFGYACHATVLSDYCWSGDYPGCAAAELEDRYDGCTALFWAGCGADQNPLPRRELELARRYGHQLAEAVSQVLQGVMEPVSGELVVTYREIPLALDRVPSEAELRRAVAEGDRRLRECHEFLLEQLARDGALITEYPYPVARWALGEQIEMVFLGGEVVVDYALRLKRERRGLRTWVAGYANDVMAYIPSERVLGEGGYEGVGAMAYYGLPAAWAPGLEQQIVDAVAK
jgi:hypothetical protein